MWKNFIRVTIRSISKNKAFNAINIAGLAIGLASAIFIILYIISRNQLMTGFMSDRPISTGCTWKVRWQGRNLKVPGTAPFSDPPSMRRSLKSKTIAGSGPGITY